MQVRRTRIGRALNAALLLAGLSLSGCADLFEQLYGDWLPLLPIFRGDLSNSNLNFNLNANDNSAGGPPVIVKSATGAWQGTTTTTMRMSITSPFEVAQDFSYEGETQLNVGDDGLPASLFIPVLAQTSSNGTVESSIFAVGQSRDYTQQFETSFNGQTTTITTTTSLTVTEARFDADGFTVAYDFHMVQTYSGGTLDGSAQDVNGEIRYEVSLSGDDTLNYTSTIIQNFESTFNSVRQTGRYEGTTTGTLTRTAS